jgi:hypothetical protein
MQINYRRYAIDIETKHTAGVWSAEIRVWPLLSVPGTFTDNGLVKGCLNQEAAEKAGRQWDEERIDRWVAFPADDK